MVPAHFSSKNPVLSGFLSWLVPLNEPSSVPAADLTAEGLQDSLTTSG